MLAALWSFLAQVEELIPHKCLSPNDPLAKDAAGQLPTLKRSLLPLSCPAESKKGTNRQGNTLNLCHRHGGSPRSVCLPSWQEREGTVGHWPIGF